MNISLKILSILFISFILFAVFIGIRYFSEGQVSIKNVRITNVTGTSATVTWVSEEPAIGTVIYGESNTWIPIINSIGKAGAYDDRDIEEVEYGKYELKEKGEYYVHHVTIRGLNPESKYYYRISSGLKSVEYEYPALETGKELDAVNTPYPVYGVTYDEQNAISKDAIIYIRLENELGKSQILSTFTTEDSGWSVDIGTIRLEDLSKYFNRENINVYIDVEADRVSLKDLEVDPTLLQPVEDIELWKSITNKDLESRGGSLLGSNVLHKLLKGIKAANEPECFAGVHVGDKACNADSCKVYKCNDNLEFDDTGKTCTSICTGNSCYSSCPKEKSDKEEDASESGDAGAGNAGDAGDSTPSGTDTGACSATYSGDAFCGIGHYCSGDILCKYDNNKKLLSQKNCKDTGKHCQKNARCKEDVCVDDLPQEDTDQNLCEGTNKTANCGGISVTFSIPGGTNGETKTVTGAAEVAGGDIVYKAKFSCRVEYVSGSIKKQWDFLSCNSVTSEEEGGTVGCPAFSGTWYDSGRYCVGKSLCTYDDKQKCQSCVPCGDNGCKKNGNYQHDECYSDSAPQAGKCQGKSNTVNCGDKKVTFDIPEGSEGQSTTIRVSDHEAKFTCTHIDIKHEWVYTEGSCIDLSSKGSDIEYCDEGWYCRGDELCYVKEVNRTLIYSDCDPCNPYKCQHKDCGQHDKCSEELQSDEVDQYLENQSTLTCDATTKSVSDCFNTTQDISFTLPSSSNGDTINVSNNQYKATFNCKFVDDIKAVWDYVSGSCKGGEEEQRNLCVSTEQKISDCPDSKKDRAFNVPEGRSGDIKYVNSDNFQSKFVCEVEYTDAGATHTLWNYSSGSCENTAENPCNYGVYDRLPADCMSLQPCPSDRQCSTEKKLKGSDGDKCRSGNKIQSCCPSGWIIEENQCKKPANEIDLPVVILSANNYISPVSSQNKLVNTVNAQEDSEELNVKESGVYVLEGATTPSGSSEITLVG